jgi:type II secretory pathway pseudopilin PulG
VILAILAAIAVPALTGYVDKADRAEIDQNLATSAKAIQAWATERYADGIVGQAELVVGSGDNSTPIDPADYQSVSPSEATTWLGIVAEYANLELDPDVWSITEVRFDSHNVLTHLKLTRSGESREYQAASSPDEGGGEEPGGGGGGEEPGGGGGDEEPGGGSEPPDADDDDDDDDDDDEIEPFTLYFGDGAGNDPANGHYESGQAGNTMNYTVPAAGVYKLEVWGAMGGSNGTGSTNGGKGGYAAGIVSLQSGVTLSLYAGGVGTSAASSSAPGGFNGGGRGAVHSNYVGSGGGASDIRIGGDSVNHRVVVAGGGGGSGSNHGSNNTTDKGGAGGGSLGGNGQMYAEWHGRGATQNAGGATGTDRGDTTNGPGKFALGGYCDIASRTGGGGGGGWYGGGAGSWEGGGGGSGWVFTESAYNAWTDTTHKSAYALNSAHYLSGTSLIDGDSQMFDPQKSSVDFSTGVVSGDTMTGNSRGGFVRITYLGSGS